MGLTHLNPITHRAVPSLDVGEVCFCHLLHPGQACTCNRRRRDRRPSGPYPSPAEKNYQ